MVYTKEEKLEVIRLYLDFGIIKYPEGITAQQKENIKKRVKSWVGVYKAKGEEGLEPKRKSYSYQDKKHAIERLLAGETAGNVTPNDLTNILVATITAMKEKKKEKKPNE